MQFLTEVVHQKNKNGARYFGQAYNVHSCTEQKAIPLRASNTQSTVQKKKKKKSQEWQKLSWP